MRKTAALAAAVLTAAAMVSGASNASAGIWGYGYTGPVADQVTCDAWSDAAWDPPYFYSYDCRYYTADPGPFNRGPGWYFWYRQDIR
ncbi:hypothetical protein [Actinokineospora diospyrosa]|uniref:Secreted protein n=1 Tax=Actinokineospora diospyrosa TaxID=103728 RepID=A0ABT1I660_9PSEU|nr:hypothetical protein [Actinokineospora diospyrosa]MCP2268125.1 hypothetical protein [Actinokineospora diospyrosa]